MVGRLVTAFTITGTPPVLRSLVVFALRLEQPQLLFMRCVAIFCFLFFSQNLVFLFFASSERLRGTNLKNSFPI